MIPDRFCSMEPSDYPKYAVTPSLTFPSCCTHTMHHMAHSDILLQPLLSTEVRRVAVQQQMPSNIPLAETHIPTHLVCTIQSSEYQADAPCFIWINIQHIAKWPEFLKGLTEWVIHQQVQKIFHDIRLLPGSSAHTQDIHRTAQRLPAQSGKSCCKSPRVTATSS